MNKEKISYKLPPDYPMYDMCYCRGKGCASDCARKNKASGICTVSCFEEVCRDFLPVKKDN